MAETDPSSIQPTSSSQLNPLFSLISLQIFPCAHLNSDLPSPLFFCFSPSFGPLHPVLGWMKQLPACQQAYKNQSLKFASSHQGGEIEANKQMGHENQHQSRMQLSVAGNGLISTVTDPGRFVSSALKYKVGFFCSALSPTIRIA